MARLIPGAEVGEWVGVLCISSNVKEASPRTLPQACYLTDKEMATLYVVQGEEGKSTPTDSTLQPMSRPHRGCGSSLLQERVLPCPPREGMRSLQGTPKSLTSLYVSDKLPMQRKAALGTRKPCSGRTSCLTLVLPFLRA